MDIEELEPRKKKGFEIGCDLSSHSIAELKQLVATLGDEIARLEDEMRAKESSRDSTDSVFRS